VLNEAADDVFVALLGGKSKLLRVKFFARQDLINIAVKGLNTF